MQQPLAFHHLTFTTKIERSNTAAQDCITIAACLNLVVCAPMDSPPWHCNIKTRAVCMLILLAQISKNKRLLCKGLRLFISILFPRA